MRRIWGFSSTLILLAGSLAAVSPDATKDPLGRALRDELARTMAELRIEGLERPYFVSYRVDETMATTVGASLGALTEGEEIHSRWLTVELRVGDYSFDNTNFFTLPSFSSGLVSSIAGSSPMPLDDDYDELRRQIWLATDAAYKQAVESLARKKATLRNKTLAAELADFSRVVTTRRSDLRPPIAMTREEMESWVVELSARLRGMPAIYLSQVELTIEDYSTRYLDSEGTSYHTRYPEARFEAKAATQARDGMEIEDFVMAYGRSLADLPRRAELATRVEALGRRLSELRQATLIERYTGPVLFEEAAAAEIFAQGFAPSLLARRRPVVGDERLASFLDASDRGFQDRLSSRVLPRFLRLVDDPTRHDFAGEPLAGSFAVDGQGVAAAATILVERGYLKTLLTDRTPILGVEHSTGNRRGGGVAPSNLIVEAEKALTADELRRELMLLVEDRGGDYGVIVRRLGSPRLSLKPARRSFGDSSPVIGSILAAYRVYPDGREELLRSLELSGLAAATFKDIVAVGDRPRVHTVPFAAVSGNPLSMASLRGFASQEGPLVSFVVPALLFEELILKKPGGEIPKPPVLPPPSF